MRMDYYIFSSKKTYTAAMKIELDEIKKKNQSFDNIDELKNNIHENRGTIIFVGPLTKEDPYEVCKEFTHLFPLTSVVLVLPKEDIDLKKAMFCGAVDVIDIDNDETQEFVNAIAKSEMILSMKYEKSVTLDEIQKEGKVITVCSTKGGVGKTTISANISAAFALKNLKVAVIDLDLQFGDLSLLLDKQPERTIYEWVKESYESGDKSFENYMNHHKTGLDILSAPTLPEFSELITGEQVAYLIEEMKKKYDVIVIDTPPAFVETSLVALENSDVILLISSLDLPSIKNGKLAIDTLNVLGLKDKIKIVLNRDDAISEMKADLVEGVLGMEIKSRIPSDYRTVISSINKGTPFVLAAQKTAVSKSIMNLISTLDIIDKPVTLDTSRGKGKTKGNKKKRFGFSFKKRGRVV